MKGLLLLALGLSGAAQAAPYVWPLSNSATPDAMNTSFGPRMNYSQWNMHDGIDLPGAAGTTCYATADGTIHKAGPGGTDGYSSRHVILKTTDPVDGTLYFQYLHLSAIEPGIVPGATVAQGAVLGYMGADDATYDHLHFEVRRGGGWQVNSVHLLEYLPYPDTANFWVTGAARFNRSGTMMAARLDFGAPSKEEGDLIKVEVDMKAGGTLLGTRTVDFDDKTTISETTEFTNDTGVEGYQSSNMVLYGWGDLAYGAVVRGLPAGCDSLVLRLTDLGGHVVSGAPVAVPAQPAVDATAGFEGGGMPAGWTVTVSGLGTGTTVNVDGAASHDGGAGLDCADLSSSEGSLQCAAAEYPLPAGRFEWTAEGWFNPVSLGLANGQAVYLLEFTSGSALSCAAYVRNASGTLTAGVAANNPGGVLAGLDSPYVVPAGTWHHWRLAAANLGTRTSHAILWIDGVEQRRLEWSSTEYEPTGLRAGIGLSSPGATAVVRADSIRVTELSDPAFPSFAPPATPPATGPPGADLADVGAEPAVIGPGDPGCVTVSRLPPGTSMGVFTPSGRRVRAFDPGELSSGTALWCLTDGAGRAVARGVYLLVLNGSGGHRRIIKLVVRR